MLLIILQYTREQPTSHRIIWLKMLIMSSWETLYNFPISKILHAVWNKLGTWKLYEGNILELFTFLLPVSLGHPCLTLSNPRLGILFCACFHARHQGNEFMILSEWWWTWSIFSIHCPAPGFVLTATRCMNPVLKVLVVDSHCLYYFSLSSPNISGISTHFCHICRYVCVWKLPLTLRPPYLEGPN